MNWNRLILAVAVGVALAGCAQQVVSTTRYTWAWTGPQAPDEGQLQRTYTACLREVGEMYIPPLYGGGNAILKTLYKDCITKAGFVKTKTDEKDSNCIMSSGADWTCVSELMGGVSSTPVLRFDATGSLNTIVAPGPRTRSKIASGVSGPTRLSWVAHSPRQGRMIRSSPARGDSTVKRKTVQARWRKRRQQ